MSLLLTIVTLSDFLDCVNKFDLSDPIISTWVSVQLFAKTVYKGDESDGHLIETVESEHPYKASAGVVKCIHVPYAQTLYFMHDPKSKINTGDTLVFYKDEECTEIAKSKKARLSFV